MDKISLNGENYVKASSIARELGYTNDYVGQLCRGGKVEAKLVGRSWYVNPDSIQAHKKSRYRSSSAKTKEAVQKEMAVYNSKENSTKKHNEHFYKKIPTVTLRYSNDSAELFPDVSTQASSTSTKIQVNHVDAQNVDVASVGDAYTIETPELAPITFKGTLEVSEHISDEITSSKSAHTKLDSGQLSAYETKKRTVHTQKKHGQNSAKETEVEAVVIHAHNIDSNGRSFYFNFGEIFLVLALALLVFLGVLGTEQVIIVTEETIDTYYNFDIKNIFRTLIIYL